METPVNPLGKGPVEPRHTGDVLHPRAREIVQSPKVYEKRPASFGPETPNALEGGGSRATAEPLTVTPDREAVGLVPKPLEKVDDRAVRVERQGLVVGRPVDLLLPNLAGRALGDGQDRDPSVEAELGENPPGDIALAEPPVDEEEIRTFVCSLLFPLSPRARAESPAEGFLEGVVVVPRVGRPDVVAAVGALEKPLGTGHHAGGHRGLASRVAHVEAGHAVKGMRRRDEGGELAEDSLLEGFAGVFEREGVEGVLLDHGHPATTVPAAPGREARGRPPLLAQGLGDGGRVRERPVEDDLGRGRIARRVVLEEESAERVFRRLLEPSPGRVAPGPEGAAGTDPHEGHRPERRALGEGDHVEIAPLAAHDLMGLDLADLEDPVADLGRLLELVAFGRLGHLGVEGVQHVVGVALEKADGLGHGGGVGLRGDEPHAGRRAVPDLVLETRAVAVGEEPVVAVPETEETRELLERLTDGRGVRVGTEAAARGPAGAVEDEAGETQGLDETDVGIALVVAEDDVVTRPVVLDEVALEEEGLGRARRHRDLDVRHLGEETADPRPEPLGMGVALKARAETVGLADVEHLARGVQHAVDPREAGGAGHETAETLRIHRNGSQTAGKRWTEVSPLPGS